MELLAADVFRVRLNAAHRGGLHGANAAVAVSEEKQKGRRPPQHC